MPDNDTYSYVSATYSDVSAAVADCQAEMALYEKLDVADPFDAVVIGKTATGGALLYQTQGSLIQDGGQHDVGWGLSTGLALALFPAVASASAGLTSVTGPRIATIAGAVAKGMDRGDLKDLGDQLDLGNAALIIAATPKLTEPVVQTLTNALLVVVTQGTLDLDALTGQLEQMRLRGVQ